jgi:rod shape-determining protein MreD
MAISFKRLKTLILETGPLILLFYICISEFHTQFYYWKIFSFNLQFIIIYYWVLRDPDILGHGFIFLSGLTNDVVLSLPLGTSALCYLFVSLVAAYVRNATVRSSLFTDWFTFIIAILIGNFLYFFLINKFAEAQVGYSSIFYNSFFTFIFYPFFWSLFEFYKKFIIMRIND